MKKKTKFPPAWIAGLTIASLLLRQGWLMHSGEAALTNCCSPTITAKSVYCQSCSDTFIPATAALWIRGVRYAAGAPLKVSLFCRTILMINNAYIDHNRYSGALSGICFKLPLYKTTAVLTPATNTVEAKISGPYYGFHAFGLCFAYRV